MVQKVLFIVAGLAGAFLLYLWIGGVLMLQLTVPEETGQPDTDRFMSESDSHDRVALIHDRIESKQTRTSLKKQAEDTLDVTMFKITDGTADMIFYTSLLEAADRGVHVRVLLDGMFYNLRGEKGAIVEAFTHHDNMELRFFEPVNVLKPWTLNNRMHDKLLIADDTFGMISGRNIGDRYFAREGVEGATDDRDAVVYNPQGADYEESGVMQMQRYFDEVWTSDYVEDAADGLSESQLDDAEEMLEVLRAEHTSLQDEEADLYGHTYDWEERTYPVNQVTFIHNPLGRMNKEPWVWQDLTALMEEAESSVLMQSPFIVPTNPMLDALNREALPEEVRVVTNSLAASPNLPAYSRFTAHREDLAASQADLLEYQAEEHSIHGKSYVFDDRLSAIGSFNLDPRSVYLSTESMLVIDSEDVNHELRTELEQLMNEQSLQVTEDGDYAESDHVDRAETPITAEIGKRLLRPITAPFEHLF
ncbi:phospholipase D-like domain-containing protein [Alkalicoccus luteus]|uniref:phospholipase D-like domain-containing protein n=1 Tax=Alkalicoccus luteus TaxID=1237094 RepID=UPI0040336665